MRNAREVVCELLLLADIRVGGKRPWDIRVHDERFFSRVLNQHSLGLGESYMDGWWDCRRLDVFFAKLLGARLDENERITLEFVVSVAKSFVLNKQSRSSAKKNVEYHYDIGNDLYSCMLGPTMTYSCGYWKEAKTLEQAQRAKHDLLCRKIGLKKGMTVLDIGCGWGGFAEHAARECGAKVVGITLSKEQAKLARQRCKGLPVTIKLQDYRDEKGVYDRIVSVGMFEHVGAKNHRSFFEAARRCCKNDGLLLLHTIGGNQTRVVTDPWIAKYIFPNGLLPSPQQLMKASERVFVLEDWHNFGPDYDTTLLAWHKNFVKNWPRLKEAYGPGFKRMWDYYLLSCAGAFRCRNLQLWQLVFSQQGRERYVAPR